MKVQFEIRVRTTATMPIIPPKKGWRQLIAAFYETRRILRVPIREQSVRVEVDLEDLTDPSRGKYLREIIVEPMLRHLYSRVLQWPKDEQTTAPRG